MKIRNNKSGGFTLFEILISLAILVTISSVGFVYLSGFRQSSALNFEANKLVSNLRQAQNRAITGQELSAWGIRLRNRPIIGNDHYATFKGDVYNSANETEKVYLNKLVDFSTSSIAVDSFKDVVFGHITGTTTAVTIILVSKNNSNLTKTITVNSIGQINVE